MDTRLIRISILIISIGIGIWLAYDLAVSGVNSQKIILLLYVVLAIAAFALLPAQEAAQKAPVTESHKAGQEEIILNVIRLMGKAKRHDLLSQIEGLSRSSLGRLLDQMEAKGLIRQEGERKASYYVLGENQG